MMQSKVRLTLVAVVFLFLSLIAFASDREVFFGNISEFDKVATYGEETIAKKSSVFTDGLEEEYAMQCDTCPTTFSGSFSFPGGVGSGYTEADDGNLCTFSLMNAGFSGGIADGYAEVSFGTNCSQVVALNPIFEGGIADGYAEVSFGTNCSQVVALHPIFEGGIADGYAEITLFLDCSVLTPPQTLFSGGVGAGYSEVDFGTACIYTLLNPSYSGGVSDGFDLDEFGTICVYHHFNPSYSGGISDGFDFDEFGTTCTYIVSNFLYPGGVAEGYSEAEILFVDPITCDFLNPLPIEVVHFEAIKENEDRVRTEWITMSERDNDYFTVERSENGFDWEGIGIVPGAGNSATQLDYDWYDMSPKTGISYYRLKQTDFDGKFSYSDIRSVVFGEATDGDIVLYPNPTDGTIKMVLLNGELKEATIQLYAASGQLIYELNNFSGKSHSFDLSNYEQGVYLFKIWTEKEMNVFKVVKR